MDIDALNVPAVILSTVLFVINSALKTNFPVSPSTTGDIIFHSFKLKTLPVLSPENRIPRPSIDVANKTSSLIRMAFPSLGERYTCKLF